MGASAKTGKEVTKSPNETTLDEHGVDEQLTKWDWILPGLGEAGPKCESDAVPPGNAICPTGDSIRYEPLRCRKVECPNCYKDEQVERTFRITVELEAYAKVHGERPHAIACSVPPEQAEEWTYDRLNTSLARRGYRRMERQCDVVGGYAVLHPWRLRQWAKQLLKREGYGDGGFEGGYWKGVRNDALEWGDPRKYAELSPHLHNIGFPERIEPHEADDFVVAKYDELEEMEDVVRHTRYLLSHRGVREGDEVGRSVRPWGAFHHASNDWGGAEEELGEGMYERLCGQVAELLGYVWDEEEGLAREETSECPCCGESVEEFYDLRELPDLVEGWGRVGEPWVQTLESEQREFFEGLFDEWRTSLEEEGRGIELDDIAVPDSVTVWSARDDEEPEVSVGADLESDEELGDTDGEMSQRKRRALLRKEAVGDGRPREELVESIEAPAEKLENDIEQMLRRGELIDAGLGRIRRG